MLRQRPRKYLPDWRKQKPNLANHICRTYCLISDIKTEPWQTVVYRAGDILKYKLKTEYNEIYQEDIRQRSVPFSSQNLRFPVMLWQFCTGLPGVNFRSSADRTRCRTLQRERTGWGISRAISRDLKPTASVFLCCTFRERRKEIANDINISILSYI